MHFLLEQLVRFYYKLYYSLHLCVSHIALILYRLSGVPCEAMTIILDFVQNVSARKVYYTFAYDISREVLEDVLILCNYFDMQVLLRLVCEKCIRTIQNPILRFSHRRQKQDIG